MPLVKAIIKSKGEHGFILVLDDIGITPKCVFCGWDKEDAGPTCRPTPEYLVYKNTMRMINAREFDGLLPDL